LVPPSAGASQLEESINFKFHGCYGVLEFPVLDDLRVYLSYYANLLVSDMNAPDSPF
jgi:hypothetical protein